MRTLFTPLASLLFGAVGASPLLAQQPVSPAEYYSRSNPPPTDPRIVGLEARLSVLEEKVAAQEPKLDAILKAVSGKAAPVASVPASVVAPPLPKAVSVAVAGVRAPLSHTHTCSQGHSWDHVANPTHNCPVCGEYVTRVDSPSRMVNVNVAAPVAVTTVSEVSGSYYSISASGGCASGQCSAPSSGFARRGLLGWRR